MLGYYLPRLVRLLAVLGLGGLAACGGVEVNPDGLSRNLPPDRAQVCRNAVSDALIREGIDPGALKNVDYQAVEGAGPRNSNRLRGFQAWVYPKSGGALLVELSQTCQVQDVRRLR